MGTREPRKNLERVSAAFKNLRLTDFQLVIAGNPGWGRNMVGSENIKITGFLSNQDLATLYSGATCFVYPSLYEGFGLPVIEAFACGTPVVTSNRGSLAEIVGTNAVMVDPLDVQAIGDGISKILNLSVKERKNLTARAQKHSQKFTWKKSAEETLAVYKEIVGNS